jgi:hypothetical protein
MNRNLLSAGAMGAVTTMALLATAVITSTTAFADEITEFVSTRTRDEVTADLKVPWPGGNPWSGAYNMFQARSNATSEQVQREYTASRDRYNAIHGEDSGSVYMTKEQDLAASSTSVRSAAAP